METRGRTKHAVSAWIPVILWMGIIFILSGRHSVQVSETYVWNFLFFKALHVIEYAVLFTLSARASKSYRFSFILTVIYAVTDEVHQVYVPSREGTLRDVIIDAIGAGGTWFYLSKLLPKAPKKLKTLARRLDLPM